MIHSSHVEAASELKQLVAQPEAEAAITARGQARTLQHHTHPQSMAELMALLKRHLQTDVYFKTVPRPQAILVACRAEDEQHRLTFENQPPKKIETALKQRHPGYTQFSNSGFFALLQKLVAPFDKQRMVFWYFSRADF